ncbi:hypothetical protein GC425_05620 [Corynebacterium sp. zg254]|uniref:Uncharacterized protein n=1 Tax=Corynebacterium zhongnanshanii TaxID=2768834 RepID=A0ABQ6VCT4_9CORY|nr:MULTISPECIES: hypothetical protein [Corynebacterium]KAB3520732.1 hypothetical protein F8377_05640 [Corynebacterium zhongnanshanii]MCR5914343.1 hypothetical protein [Corynebacterium sp. zg254]
MLLKNSKTLAALFVCGAMLVACGDSEEPSSPVEESGTVVKHRLDQTPGEQLAGAAPLMALVSSGSTAQVQGFSSEGKPVADVSTQVAAVKDSRLERFADGYAVADKNAIAVLNSSGTRVKALPVPEVDENAALAASDSSPHFSTTIMAFDLPPEDGGTADRTRIAKLHSASGQGSGDINNRVITRKADITSLTACDDGSALWLEFKPSTLVGNSGAGVASLVTWTEENGVETYPIDYEFAARPWDINQLDCERKHHRLVADDGSGGVINLGIQKDGPRYKVAGKRPVKKANSDDIDGSYGAINGDMLTTINDKGTVTVIDMYKGEVASSVEFSQHYMDRRNLTATSADGAYVYALFGGASESAEDGSSRASAVIMDFNQPSCRRNIELEVPASSTVTSAFMQVTDSEKAIKPPCQADRS